ESPTVLTAPPTGVAGALPSIFFFDPGYQNPEVHQASAGFERQLTDDLVLAVGYMFVAGRHLQRARDYNIGTPVPAQVPLLGGGSGTIQPVPTLRPFPHLARLLRVESTAESTYNGGTVELRKRFGGKVQANLAYRLGKVKDTKPDATGVVPGNAGDDAKYASNPADFEADRAPGDLDQRHRLVFSGYWDLDYFKSSGGALKAICGGWHVSWISTIEGGLPYSRRITNDVNRDQNPSNDIVPGFRNSERLPAQYNTDLRLSKRMPLGPRARLELIGEGFNIFNQTNVTARQSAYYNFTNGVLVPQTNLANPRLNFGTDSGATIGPDQNARVVQLAAKVTV